MAYDSNKQLAISIIIQAIRDYQLAWRYSAGIIRRMPPDLSGPGKSTRAAIRGFVDSDLFTFYAEVLGFPFLREHVNAILDKEDFKYAKEFYRVDKPRSDGSGQDRGQVCIGKVHTDSAGNDV